MCKYGGPEIPEMGKLTDGKVWERKRPKKGRKLIELTMYKGLEN